MPRKTKAATAVAAADHAQGLPATFTKPEPVAPVSRKGKSTVDNPVGIAWVTCLNTTTKAGELQVRKVYTKAVMAAGVTYYTARTQVNRYLQWVAAGSPEAELPRGVELG